MTRNCPKIHFNIVKNYVSTERKVIRHVINDVITNYTEPPGCGHLPKQLCTKNK